MPKIKFSTKGGTLKGLAEIIQSARIPTLHIIRYDEWIKDSALKQIELLSQNGVTWAVRSSSIAEDTEEKSNAGAFLSELNVTASEITGSVSRVFQSYDVVSADNEVLVQPMLTNVVLSGVAFTHDPNTGSPYRTINWSSGEDTSFVTSGAGGNTWKQAAAAKYQEPEEFSDVNLLIKELLKIFSDTPLDIEFAITKNGADDFVLWLLQVRPLLLQNGAETAEKQAQRLSIVEKKLENSFKQHPHLKGDQTIFGVMTDWNPAEMIGLRPKPLALSLYRELVTDMIWAYQRHNYGYRNLRSFPLMQDFFGLPYIDIRLSFNSFVPADLDENLAEKLVNFYTRKLLKNPVLHDKVEFEIVFSCYEFDLRDRLRELAENGFSDDEILKLETSLLTLTNKIICSDDALYKKDAEKVSSLMARNEKVKNSDLSSLEKIYWLIEDAKRYGTLPFAGLARAGFIAMQLLNSLVRVGALSLNDRDSFLANVSTISSRMSKDLNVLSKSAFLEIYGHLRPGTYDILSHRYDEAPEFYFDWSQEKRTEYEKAQFSFSTKTIRAIDSLLLKSQLDVDAERLFSFISDAIQLREFAKFEFSRSISDALELITELGESFGILRADLAYLDYTEIKNLLVRAKNIPKALEQSILVGKEDFSESKKLVLPPLITNSEQVWAFSVPASQPNFITQLSVKAEVRHIILGQNNINNLEGKIVCIESADPGYDWLFTKGIAGLVTKWGGANSHMAIRSGELRLPAIIGSGEEIFDQIKNAKIVYFDCASNKVEIIR